MRLPFSLLLLLVLVPTYSGEPRVALLGDDPDITLTPVPLDPSDPAHRRDGALTFLAGYQLKSRDPAFGGFSSMSVQGNRFTLLSDAGNIVRFTLTPRGTAEQAAFANLPAGPGTGWRKLERDSESLVVDPVANHAWIGFEVHNAIWRYDAALTRADRHAEPPAMRKWPESMGPETLVKLRDGRFVSVSEGGDCAKGKAPPQSRDAVLFPGDPTLTADRAIRFCYAGPAGYAPTDMAQLPDGRLMLLNRRARIRTGFTNRVTIIDPAQIKPGAVVKATIVAAFDPPLTHDNFEALAITRERGQTVVWIASDDNLAFFQRSLLLKFRFDPQASPRAETAP